MANDPIDYKRVADPVHGTIGLSEIEVALLDTAAFRRLGNIRQLGLAYYVYPGADYSRLSHSLGVCHVTGEILDAIRKAGPNPELTAREYQLYRLAALLHDIGHYPFSHAMEHAIENHFSSLLLKSKGSEVPHDSHGLPQFFKHERVGQEILEHDGQVNTILKSAGFEPKEVYSIFNRQEPPRFANLVSSDLDADRIDYLLRTAHHTGLPYGSVDMGYLLSQVRLDRENRICITDKAVRTADHFLLCRHFDYQQISFHKTVAALELLLKDVLRGLVQSGSIDASAAGIQRIVKSGDWSNFDDHSVGLDIRQIAAESTDEVDRRKAEAIIRRTPPKMVANYEFFGNSGSTERYDLTRKLIKSCIDEWANDFGIDRRFWYIWNSDATLTKIGPHLPLSAAKEIPKGDQERFEQAIRVATSNGGSRAIMELQNSLMSLLSEYSLFSIRVYVLLSKEQEAHRSEIEARIRKDVSET